MGLRDFLRVVRKNVWIIVALVAASLIAAVAFSALRTPLYEAKATVFVSSQAGGTIAEVQQGSSFTQSRVTTYTRLVTTPSVLQPVIDELDLDTTPAQLAEHITANNPLNTSLIEIQVRDPDAADAAVIADALGDSLRDTVQRIETPLDQSTSPVRLTQVESASVPIAPVVPNVLLNVGLALVIGLALAAAAVVARESLDTRVRRPSDIQRVTATPIVGSIPYDPAAKKHPLVRHDDRLSRRAESFRTLRTNLQYLELFDGPTTFVITSSVPGEGKTSSAINIARALADVGTRTLLVDADLRRPKTDVYLGIEGGLGLTDLLIGRARVEDVVIDMAPRGFSVLPAGRIPPNPSELLSSPRMKQLIAQLSLAYDVVIIDAPPLLPVSDAAVLAKQTRGALVLVGAGRVTRTQLQESLEGLRAVGATVAGVVLSMAPTRGPDAHGYGYGSYGTYSASVPDTGWSVSHAAAEASAGVAGHENRSPVADV
jgi:capsular exopolysaccharide synthesis family protein